MRIPEFLLSKLGSLGNPHQFTIRELADQVIELTGSKSPVIKAPLPPDDHQQRQPAIPKSKQELGQRPLTISAASLSGEASL